MSAALLLSLVLSAAPDAGAPGKDAPRAAVPDVLGAMKTFTRQGHEGVTACSACHATSSWTDVRFNHERTGFSLTGRHARTTCKACHVTDFAVPLPRGCAACHRDVHAGELGARCEGCHDTTDWRSRFDSDAHRRTNFPLVGAHAALPCTECHAEARQRQFTRRAVDCQGCHLADALRTSMASSQPVNHVALGLDQRNCRECHTPLAFRPARFPTHDECFPISAGVHAVPCLNCHTALTGGVTLKCGTGTADCKHCHTNDGTPGVAIALTDQQHPPDRAPGYLFDNRACLSCHFPRGAVAP